MIGLSAVTVRFGGVVALDAVSVEFTEPVCGIIGPNGAGKTTLMNVISGFVASTGQIAKDGTDILSMAPHRRAKWGLRRSFQKEEIADDLSAFENVLVQTDSLPGHSADKRREAADMLAFVGMSAAMDRPGARLNKFERRLTDVARCLTGQPKLIMFDEPAGGLSIEETARLGDLIQALPDKTGAQVLVIDHDVDLIRRICTQTLVLDFGQRIAFGATAAVLADPRVKAAYLGTDEGAT